MIKKITLLLFIIATLSGETFQDRLLIYIENDIKDFTISADGKSTNLAELNELMDDLNAEKIYPWLKTARPTDRDGDIYLNRYYVLNLGTTRSDLLLLKSTIESEHYIRSAEEMGILKPTYIPNDPQWSQQYFLPLIEADQAFDIWDIDGGDIPGEMTNGVMTVAIIDQGVDWDHPDLVDNLWNNLGEDADGDGVTIIQSGNNWIFDPGDQNGIDDDGDGFVDNFIGWDVSGDDNDPVNVSNALDHGTLVAGSAAGTTNNGAGIASVGWGVKIMSINASHDPNFVSDGYSGILASAQMGADVINCSWGSFGGGNQSVINVAYNTYGAIIVASSGNGGDDGHTNFDTHYPSASEHVISVSATGPNDNFGCWATAGSTVDICAPGESIRTTNVNGGYTSVWGTSFSSPITAGAVALLWSRFPNESQEWVEDRIISTADYFTDMDGSCYGTSMVGMLGTGRLNIFKALAAGVYPNLVVEEVQYQNDDDDDGQFNPGETVNVKMIVGNEVGWADAFNVIGILESDDPRITILDNTITFPSAIPAGSSAFTLFDHFQVSADADASLGDISCEVTLYATTGTNSYQTTIEIELSLSLNQYGFPYSVATIKSSPIVADLNNDGDNEVYFGSDDFNFYGLDDEGDLLPAYPYSTSNQVRSGAAVGDVDGDGELEIVFGSKDRKMYILAPNGALEYQFQQSGYIMSSPALVDMDGDNDLEIIFNTFDGSGGKIFAIHHNGVVVTGFPVNVGEIMMVGPAVQDLEGDGIIDIVSTTWGNNIWAVDATGIVKDGFPYSTADKFNCPPSIADLDGDGDMEIIAGDDDGFLYILHHDGTEMGVHSFGGDIRGGIAIGDISGNGNPDLVFGGYDQFVHVLDPMTGTEVNGWPVDVNWNIAAAPALADIDNDGQEEIIVAHRGAVIFVFENDGSTFDSFPVSVGGAIESSPSVQDLDNDGDYEILVGSSQGLKVIDIKSPLGEKSTWNVHRGNLKRTGFYDVTQLSIGNDEQPIIPNAFLVSNNYPNPFNPSTSINISLPNQTKLIVSVFDISGRLMSELVNNQYSAGTYSITWNGLSDAGVSLPSGIYFLEVKTDQNRDIQKLAFIK